MNKNYTRTGKLTAELLIYFTDTSLKKPLLKAVYRRSHKYNTQAYHLSRSQLKKPCNRVCTYTCTRVCTMYRCTNYLGTYCLRPHLLDWEEAQKCAHYCLSNTFTADKNLPITYMHKRPTSPSYNNNNNMLSSPVSRMTQL